MPTNGVVTYFTADFHRAELRRMGEVGNLAGLWRGFIVISAGDERVEREVKLVFSGIRRAFDMALSRICAPRCLCG